MTHTKFVFARVWTVLAVVVLASRGTAAVCREPVMISNGPASAGAVSPGPGLSQTEAAVINKTNAARVRSGLPPLAADGQLMNGARNHARWMASNRNLSHGSGVAENIGMGQHSAAEAVSSWMQSSGHRANILDAGHTRIGVAMAHSPDGTAYWCQQFR